ncbi:unnamed protein product [Closterium sp. NIES-53]
MLNNRPIGGTWKHRVDCNYPSIAAAATTAVAVDAATTAATTTAAAAAAAAGTSAVHAARGQERQGLGAEQRGMNIWQRSSRDIWVP